MCVCVYVYVQFFFSNTEYIYKIHISKNYLFIYLLHVLRNTLKVPDKLTYQLETISFFTLFIVSFFLPLHHKKNYIICTSTLQFTN